MKATQLLQVVMLAAFAGFASAGRACAQDDEPEITPSLARLFRDNDFVVLAEWVKSSKPESKDDFGITAYKVKQIAQNFKETVRAGDEAIVSGDRMGKAGEVVVLSGYVSNLAGRRILWDHADRITPAAFKYATEAPSPRGTPPEKWLKYFGDFIHDSDPVIATDACQRFAMAPFKDFTKAAQKMSRADVRKWVLDPKSTGECLGLYGKLLGVRGRADDAKALTRRINEDTEDWRTELEGLMSGYLMLTGADGLVLVDEQLKDFEIPYSEANDILKSLRFMKRNLPDRIEDQRLLQSVRLLLDRPDFSDLVISDLQRWKDWSVQDQLMKMYPKGTPSIKRAIIRYMLACSKDGPKKDAGKAPEHAAAARKHLEELRRIDPKRVEETERFSTANFFGRDK